MSYRLAIKNTVKVPVKIRLNDDGVTKVFPITLICDRLENDVVLDRIQNKDGHEKPLIDLLNDITKGWQDQRLIVNEDGSPAEFNAESLALLLGIFGAANDIALAYMEECKTKAKN